MNDERDDLTPGGIAIIGMVGRFPGAGDLDMFWRNICNGTESIARFPDEELQLSAYDAALAKNPSYVKARGVVDGADLFDPAFFGYSGRDALLMDPQHRLFLESAWEVLELAGYDPRTYKGLIGVYGGSTQSSYQPYLYSHFDLLPNPDALSIALGNDLPFLTTRVSYKLDLKGPSCPVQTACSTSLVAVHLACQGLLNAECDMAIAGGVSLRLPQHTGYLYQEDSILSPDGHCRSFDASARGTVFSNGLGMVALKRLDDAVADRDTIYAVIRGSAINNDGSRRASFTAPGVYGQSSVIADALAAAGVAPDTLSYIEAHGTATSLGDSIEIQALNKAFSRSTTQKQFCAIGTVKANIGHLDAAAGIAGLIKVALMLRNGMMPPLAMFERPNPDLQLENTPFYVNTALRAWTSADGTPRRAGVSSFGFGGTNAHVVVEDPPALEPTDESRPSQVLVLSAESAEGLERLTAAMASQIAGHPGIDLADAAFTLQVGRRAFRHRRALVCRTAEEARALLESRDPRLVFSGLHDAHDRGVVFMFPGQGSQHVEMGRDLYALEPVFRDAVDECAELLRPYLEADVRDLLYPEEGATPATSDRLTRTRYAQPALFVVEYALARLFLSWGIQPAAMVGHSVGEWVAACVADVVSLGDALRLVAARGRLMEEMPAGVMIAVPVGETQLRTLLAPGLSIAALNAPSMSVVSGTADAIGAFQAALRADGIEPQRLQTSHAFHSAMMDAAVPKFVETVRQVKLSPPKIPFVSNVTGALITEAEATDPEYWGRQIREAVRFGDGAAALLAGGDRVFLEVGPAQALTTLVRRQPSISASRVIPSLRRTQEHADDDVTVGAALARLWVAGVRVDWAGYYGEERRRRIPLPTYPFDRQRYWVQRAAGRKAHSAGLPARNRSGRSADVSEWFYAPSWARVPLARSAGDAALAAPATWLVFEDDAGLGGACAARVESAGHTVVRVRPGDACAEVAPGRWTIDPFSRPQHDQLVQALARAGRMPDRVLHCWGVNEGGRAVESIAMQRDHHILFWSVTLLAAALADANAGSLRITVATTGVQDVMGEEPLQPGKAPVLGLCRVIPQEHATFACRCVDFATVAEALRPPSVEALLREASVAHGDPMIAFRGPHRLVEDFRPVALRPVSATPATLRPQGVYLITGGLGDIGLTFAEHLARAVKARLVLVGRSGMPEESTWSEYLRTHPEADPMALTIQRLRRIQSLGGEYLIVRGDVSSAAQMASAFEAADRRFGGVNGVIHGAGLVTGDAFRTLLETDEDIVTRQFTPKIAGLAVLDAVMRGRALDFCMVVSSLSVILGGLRYAAYSAANAYLDAVVHARNRTSAFPWITVNWDGWLRAEEEAALARAAQPVAGFVMTDSEGADAFGRILTGDAGNHVVVSTGDLQSRIEQWVRLATVSQAESGVEPEQEAVRLPRPNLQTEFVGPRNDLEHKLAGIWQGLLALDRVGINDSFFELGGDSLLGIQLTTAVKKQLGAKVSAVTLFEAPTVAALAALIESQAGSPAAPAGAVDASRQRGARRREKQARTVTSGEPMGA